MNVILDFFPSFNKAAVGYIFCFLAIIISFWALKDKKIYYALLFHPYEVYRYKRWYTLFSAAFIHRSYTHLLVNCIFILLFMSDIGSVLSYTFSPLHVTFLCLYLISMLILIPHIFLVLSEKSNFIYTCVGSSGITYGLISFSLAYFPMNVIDSKLPFISYSYHIWIAFLIIMLLVGLLSRKRINSKLHLFAYMLGSLLAIGISPAYF